MVRCKQCQQEFVPPAPMRGRLPLYCSDECRAAKARERALKYLQVPEHRDRARAAARAQWQRNKKPPRERPCIICGVPFTPAFGQTKLCSPECRHEHARRRDRASGRHRLRGYTPAQRLNRNATERQRRQQSKYKDWRRAYLAQPHVRQDHKRRDARRRALLRALSPRTCRQCGIVINHLPKSRKLCDAHSAPARVPRAPVRLVIPPGLRYQMNPEPVRAAARRRDIEEAAALAAYREIMGQPAKRPWKRRSISPELRAIEMEKERQYYADNREKIIQQKRNYRRMRRAIAAAFRELKVM